KAPPQHGVHAGHKGRPRHAAIKGLLTITEIATGGDQPTEDGVNVLRWCWVLGQLASRREFERDWPIGVLLHDKIPCLNINRPQRRIPPQDLDYAPPDLA